MKNKKHVPDIRFRGFVCDWELRRFDGTFSILSNNTLSRADLNDEKGSTKNVHYGDILIKFGECTDVSREDIPYISDEIIAVKYLTSRLQEGDIVFADTAEDATAGKCTEFFNIKGQPIISGLHTIPCHPLLPFSTGYLGYYLNSPSFHNQLLPLMQGTKVVGISKTAIKGTNISFPDDTDEQHAIGNYFQNMDRLINTSQAKLDKLKNIKKACLEKMFPCNGSTTPELRFKGFSEEWKKNYLKNITAYKNGKGYEDKQSDTGKYELINLNSISIDGGLKRSGKFIDSSNETLSINDIVMVLSDVAHGDLLGRVALIPESNKYVLNQRIALLRPNDDVIPLFLFTCINSHQRYFKNMGAGSSQLNISKDCVENFNPLLPVNKIEQKKIGNILKNLDDLIAKTEQQINKLKNIKKACLDKMFVNTEGAV